MIQLSCIGRAQPDDLRTILPALAHAAETVDLEHARLAAVLDWVQYKHNFRAAVMVRPFGEPGTQAADGPLAEIAIDVRRAKDIPYDELVEQIVDRLSKALGIIPDVHECIHLEDWVRPSKSVIWSFNRSYWRHLAAWDETFQKDYAAALPGGVSDGTNPAFWQEQIETFMDTLDRLDEWSEMPDEIVVLEFGVGDGQQAKVWLDTFAAACAARGRDYLDRVRYMMADYSPHVLSRAREHVVDYAEHVQALELDFRHPLNGMSDMRGKVLFAHTCNLYDNLPTDEVMRVGDRAYEPLVRASITPREVVELAEKYAIPDSEIVATTQRVLRHGPEALGDLAQGVRFWSDVWDALHLEEIYSEVTAPSALRVAPSADLHVDEIVDDLPEWTRVHMSTVAVESFGQTLHLLHHEGVLVAQDIFVREVGQYAAFRGPGKLEGSVVNWLNGPVFVLVGERGGFRVKVEPFAYR
ncbi:MAG TPA: SAM-dependent methyltransferase, partial [Solirubrobacteraceae bacterium]|nr:SAM-dependent methyltransferase [Solirubrobacteraceae bacterium]